MRRRDIQLLANARQGDLIARRDVGKRYLRGDDGFPRHLEVGLEHLRHASVADPSGVAIVIAESLSLHELVQLHQLTPLEAAAKAGCVPAQVKLAAWLTLTCDDLTASTAWLHMAARSGHAGAQRTLRDRAAGSANHPAAVMLCLHDEPEADYAALLCLALTRALEAREYTVLERLLTAALALKSDSVEALEPIVCDVLAFVETVEHFQLPPNPAAVETILERSVYRGNRTAALLLGRALCGLDAGCLGAKALVAGQNMRKGAALLLRAADAGVAAAWLLLYQVHSDNHSSVANPQMARFFLEKAARAGEVVAQRWLGALILRAATTVHESEHGIHWLHEAARQRDAHAAALLRSLVLQVNGSEQEAARVLAMMHREDPWLACRLRTARDFGLTKQEALCIDLAASIRPWGMVVVSSPFSIPMRRSAARAVPALQPEAALNLRRSVAALEHARQEGVPPEGNLRKRSIALRRLLEKHGAGESLFFADAQAGTLNTLRTGTRWAFHARQSLHHALTA